jgi:16S rRNA processing protein RimM
VPEYLQIGKVLRPHGIRGAIRVLSTTDSPELRFAAGEVVRLLEQEYEIMASRKLNHDEWLIEFVGVQDREAAEKLRAAELLIDRKQADLKPGELLRDELIGFEVTNPGGDKLGEVVEVINTGSNDICVVKDGKKEFMIPLVVSAGVKIEADKHRIVVESPEDFI